MGVFAFALIRSYWSFAVNLLSNLELVLKEHKKGRVEGDTNSQIAVGDEVGDLPGREGPLHTLPTYFAVATTKISRLLYDIFCSKSSRTLLHLMRVGDRWNLKIRLCVDRNNNLLVAHVHIG
jgi:hypothetical protein